MTITNFREVYKDRAVSLKLDSIILTEHCHKKALEKNSKISKLKREPLCIVHENDSGTYNLIVGYRDYITAKNNGAQEVSAIIVPDNSRKNFLESLNLTVEICEIDKIHPPKSWTPPNPQKIRDCLTNYDTTGTFGKSVVISPDGTILDGYSAVEAARLLKLRTIPVHIVTTAHWAKLNRKHTKSR